MQRLHLHTEIIKINYKGYRSGFFFSPSDASCMLNWNEITLSLTTFANIWYRKQQRRRRHFLIKTKFSINYTSFPHFIFLTRKNETNFFFLFFRSFTREKKEILRCRATVLKYTEFFCLHSRIRTKSTPNDINRMTFLVFFFVCLYSQAAAAAAAI